MSSTKSAQVICIIGVDGTGKTVHSVELIKNLEKKGRKCKYVWFGSPNILSLPFMVICRFLGLTKIHHLPGGEIYSEHHYYRNKPIALIWPWVQLVDLAISALFRVFPSVLVGHTVVCDRYVYDALVGIMDDVKDYELYRKSVGQIMFRLKPSCSRVFLLDVNDTTAFLRKKDIPNIEYVTRRRKSFQLIARYLNIPIVNADQPFDVVQKQLIVLL
jgi:thymidylate kinase